MIKGTDILKQAMLSTKLSRLIAQENIAVEFSEHAETASFSPKQRILTFPYSTTFMESDVHELFMMHEISHALHLPQNIFSILDEAKVSRDLFNIIVDIRDERLIKKRYPGTVKSFNTGYEKLLDQGFFGKKEEINFKGFENRLNVYAKVGPSTGAFIKFSPDEYAFYEKCMKAETIEELIALTRDLVEIAKLRAHFSFEDLEKYVRELLGDSLDTDDNDNYVSAEERQRLIYEEMKRIQEERVQEIFDKNFKDSLLTNISIHNLSSMDKDDVSLISCKKYVEFVKDQIKGVDILDMTSPVRSMRSAIKQSVDSMVRVFESRKAAARYKNAKISDTGAVDINQVFKYQFDDNIFRRSVKLHNSKNHGYIILMDLSGSMHRVVDDVFDQVIVITEFFRRIQVPYKVIGFGASTNYTLWHEESRMIKDVKNTLLWNKYVQPMIEFMSSTQTTLEHNISIYGMTHRQGFHLRDTPTGYTVLATEIIATEFFKKYGVDQKHIIVMTDGEPSDMATNSWRNHGKTIIISDAITKKNIVTKGNASYAGINAIGKIFEHRHGIKMTTICITRTYTDSAISAFISAGASDSDKSKWRTKGYVDMVDPYTHNKVYFAKPFNVETEVDGFDVNSEKTAKQIAREITKTMKLVKKSRTFLNTLAESLS